MVCSCAILSNCLLLNVLLQIIFCSYVIETILLGENGRLLQGSTHLPLPESNENKLGDRIRKQLLARLSQNIVICQSLADQLFASGFGFSK